MKELLKQYRDIKADHDMLISLATKWQGISDEMTIHEALKCLGNHLYDTSSEIVNKLQQQLDAAGERKPLWAVIAAGEPDHEARATGIMGSSKYRMYFTKKDAQESIGDSIDKKVVPVWGE
jgi:hypothetical protein